MLAAGAILPNIVDKPLGTLIAPDFFGSDRLFGHSLVFSSALIVVVLLATRRGRRRRAWMALAVGAMFHLLLDGMWTSTATFLWPLFGTEFAVGRAAYWSDLSAIITPVVIAKELAGAAYLVYLYRSLGLSEPTARRQVLASGRLPA